MPCVIVLGLPLSDHRLYLLMTFSLCFIFLFIPPAILLFRYLYICDDLHRNGPIGLVICLDIWSLDDRTVWGRVRRYDLVGESI